MKYKVLLLILCVILAANTGAKFKPFIGFDGYRMKEKNGKNMERAIIIEGDYASRGTMEDREIAARRGIEEIETEDRERIQVKDRKRRKAYQLKDKKRGKVYEVVVVDPGTEYERTFYFDITKPFVRKFGEEAIDEL